jgi:hypothetical protein
MMGFRIGLVGSINSLGKYENITETRIFSAFSLDRARHQEMPLFLCG